MSTQAFVLDHLNSTVVLDTSGSMTGEAIPVLDVSATAVLHVSLASMQNVFKYETDASNISDLSASDLRFYVYADQFPYLQPSDASMVYANAIATSDAIGNTYDSSVMMVKHDFIRYIALKLFNTPNGVDLFSNVDALKTSLQTACGSGVAGNTWFDISAALFNVSVSGANTGLVGTAGSKYMLNDPVDDAVHANLCRELLMQMIQTSPSRFNALSADTNALRSLPFVSGDSISFKLTISAAANQETLTGVAAIPPRPYRIQIIMDL